ncbi:hypothetical protein [Micromonospora sp. SH-82]|uniref:hypothetical protein n=1 Tax=Micromonospora sp. SH-82 TaxID=3132938 RepID=UPI003EB791BB
MSAADLTRARDLLINQVGHWQQPRWAAPAASGDVSRVDLVHRLVQEIANLAADAEGGPRRAVPRAENDLSLPDQLRVVVADLVAAEPPAEVLTHATETLNVTRRAL